MIVSLKMISYALPEGRNDCPNDTTAYKDMDCQKITGAGGGYMWTCLSVPTSWQKYCHTWD